MIEGLEQKLPDVLAHFGIYGTVGEIYEGPLVSQIEFKLNEGTKFATVEKLIKDIARELGISGVRVTQIPNSVYISFEIPQPKAQTIPFMPILSTEAFTASTYALPICIGVDMRGNPLMKDLAKMPHLLVAGTTGSGKSVGLNSFILSLIGKKSPDELKLVLVDPKRIEFSMYNKQKYMARPVITDMSEASACLAQLVEKMNERYTEFEKEMVRNIGEYHEKGKKMPYIVCVIDEFADLIMSDKTVEKQVQMLAQKSRAAGIHLIIATQRPSVDVITGTIKANLPTRLSYKVSSPADSMTILNTVGAEDLLGRGDSLLLEENGTLTRVLGAYMPNDEIMQMLEPHRCNMDNPQDWYLKPTVAGGEVVLAGSASTPTTTNTEEQKKVGLWTRICGWWNRIGKRQQNKIINWVLTVIFAAFQAKNAAQKARSTRTTVRKLTSPSSKTTRRR